MSKVTYIKCDECGKEKKMLSKETSNVITILNVAPDLPHGDFCSIGCTIVYLENCLVEMNKV